MFVASMLIQGYLSRTYRKWGNIRNPRNLTGAEVARMMLRPMLDRRRMPDSRVAAVRVASLRNQIGASPC